MVWSDCPTVRTTGSSFWQMLLGKCFFYFPLKFEASFFPHCCCRHSVAFVGNLFSFMAVSPLALLVWHVCKVVAPFLSGSGSVDMESMVLDRNGANV